MQKEPQLIRGGSFKDERGTVSFVNEFSFCDVKRFYQINNASTDLVRAWQGHQMEHKFFYASTGSFLIAWVKIDDWQSPSVTLEPAHTVLRANEPVILSIPPGYANGILALENDASLLIFSDLTVASSTNDRWIYDQNLWFNWQQFKI